MLKVALDTITLTLNDLPFKSVRMHYIRTKLCSLFLSKLHSLYNSWMETPGTNRLLINISWHQSHSILPITCIRIIVESSLALRKMTQINIHILSFLCHKGICAINLGNIFHTNSVRTKITPVLNIKLFLYYTKHFNYKHVLVYLNIYD
jgi:hypothetical protein